MKKNKSFLCQVTVVVIGVTLFCVLQNISSIFNYIMELCDLLSPCIIGFILALILNVPMRAIEMSFFKPDKDNNYGNIKSKIKRPVSLLITLFICLGIFFIVLNIVIPEIVKTINQLSDKLPEFTRKVNDKLRNSPKISEWLKKFNISPDKIGEKIQSFFINSDFISGALDSTIDAAKYMISGLLKYVLSIFFAIYILLQKETLNKQIYRLTTAIVSPRTGAYLCKICNLSKQTFFRFISGQCLEAMILGTLCATGMSIFGFPNAITIGLLVMVTAIFPIVGSVMGILVGSFLIMVIDIQQVIWFFIYMIILLQLETNLIYPKVVGKSVGLSSLWVLFAVMIGGSLGGIFGMFVSVPICSVMYTIIKEMVDNVHSKREEKELKKQKIKEALVQEFGVNETGEEDNQSI